MNVTLTITSVTRPDLAIATFQCDAGRGKAWEELLGITTPWRTVSMEVDVTREEVLVRVESREQAAMPNAWLGEAQMTSPRPLALPHDH